MGRLLAVLGVLLAIAGGAHAQVQRFVQASGGGAFVTPYPPWDLAAQYTGYPQPSTYWPITGTWVQSGAADNVTSITSLAGGTLTSYPSYSVTYKNCAGNTVSGTVSGEIGGVANAGMNTIIGMTGTGNGNWPKGVGCDAGEMAAIKAAGVYVLAGGPTSTGFPSGSGINSPYTDVTSNTSVNSVSSYIALANANAAQANLIGYYMQDEPHCPGDNFKWTSDSPAQYINIQTWDPTRIALINQTAWFRNPAVITNNATSGDGIYLPAGTVLANGQVWNGVGVPCAEINHNLQIPNSYGNSLQSSSTTGFDDYSEVSDQPAQSQVYKFQANSDYAKYPHDNLFLQALDAQTMFYWAAARQAFWAYIESGNAKNSGATTTNFTASVTNGSTTITINGGNCNTGRCVSFGPPSSSCTPGSAGCSIWLGMGITDTITNGNSCIPAGTTIIAVINDGTGSPLSTQATMSHAATTSAGCPTGSATNEKVGINSNPYGMTHVLPCFYAAADPDDNLCTLGGGNRFRPSQAEQNSEAWNFVINGANGLNWFVQDSYSNGWGYGGNTQAAFPGDPAATQAAANHTLQSEQYINKLLTANAAMLNSATVGGCATDTVQITGGADTISPTCPVGGGGGVLKITNGSSTYPGEAIVKSYNGALYLIAMPLRCSEPNCKSPAGCTSTCTWDNTAGGSFTFTLAGYAGHAGTVYYDSNSKFDAAHDSTGTPITLDGTGSFTDTLGANSDKYQVKIYRIQ